ncbi:NADH dehydrogenase [ubiquinone] 1 alpha subcomplex assembly factor 2 [Gastrophryne carolinensis]
MEKLRRLLQRTLGTVRQHMGTDQHGNHYYYIPQQRTWTGQVTRPKRIVEPANKEVYQYELGNIPTEWEAWIRGKRMDPPTIEEILRNEKLRQEVTIKAQELLEQEKSKDQGLSVEPMRIQIKGHASAPHYGKHTPSEEPISTANEFEPGTWNPQKK